MNPLFSQHYSQNTLPTSFSSFNNLRPKTEPNLESKIDKIIEAIATLQNDINILKNEKRTNYVLTKLHSHPLRETQQPPYQHQNTMCDVCDTSIILPNQFFHCDDCKFDACLECIKSTLNK